MKHLKEVNMSYFEHFKFALKTSCLLLLALFFLIIHAFLPFLFEKRASKIISKIWFSFPRKSFKELYMEKAVQLSEIDFFISEWHQNFNSKLQLHEFLGLSIEEYSLFAEDYDKFRENFEKLQNTL